MKAIVFKPVHASQRKKTLRKDGTASVWISAYQNGRHKYYPTGIFVKPDQWDTKSLQIVKHPNAVAYNSLISRKMSELMEYQVTLINEAFGEHPSLNTFDERFRATGGQKLTFCGFFKMRLKERKDISEATRQTQLNTLNNFLAAVGDVAFRDLNYNTLDAFHQYLLSEEKELTIIDKYHRHVKTYINQAISKGFIASRINPYDDFKYDKGRPKEREFLRLEELEILENMDTSRLSREMIKARDIFLLMAFTGLRFSDAVNMCPSNLTQLRQGLFYSAQMMKNRRRAKKQINLPIYAFFFFNGEEESRAQRWVKYCIKKYPARQNEPFFKGLYNAKVNENLKIVARQAGITKHLTCHVGRHSFGTNMAVKISVTLLKQYMVHSKVETTMQYIHAARKIEDDVMERIRWDK
ncbi:MAG: hypothetical protein DWQ02_24655 [Bacteroidetes bacterium]|nr:MAG: hypothetical protein DWQ02_24655 [Bacteroidota bacterium]